MNSDQSAQKRGVPAAAIAMVGWAASGVIAKGITELGTFAVVFWRMWIYAVIVILFLKVRGTPLRKESLRISWRGGVSLGADIMLFFSALRLTTVANATVIGSCQPLILLFIAGRIFGERPRRYDWVLAVVAMGGVAIVMFGSTGVQGWSLSGDLLSIATVVAWTLYFVFSKLSTRKIEASQYTGATALICALFATPFALASGQLFNMPSGNAWIWLFILSIGPGFTSHMLMNWALAHIPGWFGSTLTLAIPVTATVMAWVFLGEDVVALQFLGMGIVLFALGFIVIGQSNTARR